MDHQLLGFTVSQLFSRHTSIFHMSLKDAFRTQTQCEIYATVARGERERERELSALHKAASARLRAQQVAKWE